MKLPGLIVAPLTPFKRPELTVDWKALEREIDYICDDCKAAMISVSGVETSEYHYLSFAERKELITRTAEMIGKRSSLIVGISHASTRTALELADLAASLKAEAVQVLAPQRPYGGQPGTQELVDYFGAIADKSPLPLLLYLNPGPGAEVGPDATVAITKLPQARVAADRGDRPRRPRPLLHHDADAADHADARRLGRDHAATGLLHRGEADRCLQRQGLREGGQAAARVRAVPGEVPGQGPRACDEGGDGAH
jgi:4-hydroxy-tetrahydrodipicolinate synthase